MFITYTEKSLRHEQKGDSSIANSPRQSWQYKRAFKLAVRAGDVAAINRVGEKLTSVYSTYVQRLQEEAHIASKERDGKKVNYVLCEAIDYKRKIKDVNLIRSVYRN